eukprot:scaffold155529_cov28-Tisochrysis_lutea.AAC.3
MRFCTMRRSSSRRSRARSSCHPTHLNAANTSAALHARRATRSRSPPISRYDACVPPVLQSARQSAVSWRLGCR